MQCHLKVMVSSWLEDEIDGVVYDQYMDDAFYIIQLSEELDNADSERKSNIIQTMDIICGQPFQKNKIDSQFTKLQKQLTVGPEEEDKEFTMYKKGGTFGSIEQRPCRAHQTTFVQVKSKGSKDQAKKNLDQPRQILIQNQKQRGSLYPWDNNQMMQTRLILIFEKRSPLWVYIGELQEAQRWWSYLKCQTIIKNSPNIVKLIQRFDHDHKQNIIQEFCKKLLSEVLRISQQKKLSAKFEKNEKKFMEQIDIDMMKLIVIIRWNQRSKTFYMKDMQQKQAKKMEVLRIQNEAEYNKKQLKDMEVLSVETLKISSSECLFSLINQWLKQATTFQKNQQLKDQSFIITFRSLHIDENVEMVKPLLEITLQNKSTLDQQVKRTKNQDQGVFYRLKIFGKLSQKARNQYYRWDLFETQFENYTGTQRLSQDQDAVRDSCSLRIKNLKPDDMLCLRLVDGVAIFEESTSEVLTFNINDLFENCNQGKSIWLPLILASEIKDSQVDDEDSQQKTDNQNQQKRTVVFVEIDFLSLPSSICDDAVSYEDELETIINNDLPIMDPIYLDTIKLPELTDDNIKVVLKIIQDNYPYMKNSMKMIAYVMYIGRDTKKENMVNDKYFELKKFLLRKIIENISHQMGQFSKMIQIWRELKENLLIVPKNQKINQRKEEKKEEKKDTIFTQLETLILRIQGQDKKILTLLTQLSEAGFPTYLRPFLWYSFTDGSRYLSLLKEVMMNSFRVYAEQRNQNKQGVSEPIWYYSRLSSESAALQKSVVKEIIKFVKQEQQRGGISSELQGQQLQSVLINFMLFQQVQGSQFNLHLIQNIFVVAKKLLSLANYNYLNVRLRYALVEEEDNIGKSNLTVEKIRDLENQTQTFLLLVSLFNTVLHPYPYTNQQTDKVLLEDCSYLTCYFLKYEKGVFDLMKLHNVRPENIFSECFLNLFSDIFCSEQLFRLWDIIICENIKNLPGERGYIIPGIAAALINRMKEKVFFIFSQFDFIQCMKFEGISFIHELAILISDLNQFINEVKDCTKKVQKAVNQILDEEGSLPSSLEAYEEFKVERHFRIFDTYSYEVDKYSAQQQIPVSAYLELIETE